MSAGHDRREFDALMDEVYAKGGNPEWLLRRGEHGGYEVFTPTTGWQPVTDEQAEAESRRVLGFSIVDV